MFVRAPRRSIALAGVIAGSLALAPSAFALDEVNTKPVRDKVTVNGILKHARALQTIANFNGGTRASGTPGYQASVDYVRTRLQDAGYKVREQSFEFPFFQELAPTTLSQVSPTAKDYETSILEFSGSGDITAKLQGVKDNLVPPPAEPGSSAGCEAADFDGFQAGNVALIQRGTCDFAVKANNAAAAGAKAAIIFNEGQEGRTDTVSGTLGGPVSIPVVGVSYAVGEELHKAAAAGDVQVHVTTSTVTETRTTKNVLADSKKGKKGETVVVGAHLDSVLDGPGINDNGSGTAAILATAEAVAKQKQAPRRKLRFAFWGAEESGLLGSTHYVKQLGADGIGDIYANLNFDMVGSPNYVRFAYDGDGSAGGPAGPPGSGQLESLFTSFFGSQGLQSDPTDFDGRSDYGPFIEAGVPAGGLFTGAEGLKTAEQAKVYGGTAGIAYDVNYHQAGDTINNLNTKALNEMSDAVAHGTWTLARSKSGLYEDGSRVKRTKVRAKQLPFSGSHAQR